MRFLKVLARHLGVKIEVKIISFIGSILFIFTPTYALDQGLYGFAGFDVGYANVNEEYSEDRSGPHFDVKLLGSYYSDSLVFDLGVGWFYNEVDNNSFSVETRSPFVEGSLKYRLNENWNFGPLLMFAVSNDNSFAVNTNEQTTETFAGLRVDYEPDLFEIFKFRVSGTFQRDISISDRNVNIASIGIQIGLPFEDKSVKVIEKEKVIYRKKYIPRYIKIGTNELQATFDGNSGLYFNSNSDQANNRMVRYLERLSYFLNKYSKEWKSITISGHTDDVGTLKYNMGLSKKRALNIKKILVKEGMHSKRIKTKGFAFKRPIAKGKTQTARAKNRRVEINFNGVKNQDAFLQSLSIIE